MPFPNDAVIPQGSLILVTGVTGFLGSIIADQLLLHGYRVRGTVRDPTSDKASWMPEHFDGKYGKDKFELAQVADMEQPGCLDEAVKGCSGIIHVASVVAFEPDPNKIVTPSLAFLDNAIAAAAKEPSIKRFVLTSSSSAAVQLRFNETFDLTDQMWNEKAVKEAWAPPPYGLERAMFNYAASKVQTEQKLWQYAKEEHPHFEVNTVLPDFVIGLPISMEKQGLASSMIFLKQMFSNAGEDFRAFYPQWCVDSVDTALLHLAALLEPGTRNERIFAYAQRKTWTDFIQRLGKMYPDRTLPSIDPNEGQDLSNVVGRSKSEELLKWMGKPGWRPLDEYLKEACDAML